MDRDSKNDLIKLLKSVVKSKSEMLDGESYRLLKNRLSERDMYIIEAYYLENKTLTETAKLSKLREGKVYHIIDRALRILESELRESL